MTDDFLPLLPRRKILAGIGTAAISGAAASVVGRTAPTRAQESRSGGVVPSVCAFDLNGSLLDTQGAAPLFRRLFGDKSSVNEWFHTFL